MYWDEAMREPWKLDRSGSGQYDRRPAEQGDQISVRCTKRSRPCTDTCAEKQSEYLQKIWILQLITFIILNLLLQFF